MNGIEPNFSDHFHLASPPEAWIARLLPKDQFESIKQCIEKDPEFDPSLYGKMEPDQLVTSVICVGEQQYPSGIFIFINSDKRKTIL